MCNECSAPVRIVGQDSFVELQSEEMNMQNNSVYPDLDEELTTDTQEPKGATN